jgi:hypothetical protein
MGKGQACHLLGGAQYFDLVMMLNEQGPDDYILSHGLHHRLGVVKNERGSWDLT